MAPTSSGTPENGRAAEGMPHADEALKTRIARFEAEPGEHFAELAAALLARGHGSEALRVCEHGLQMRPDAVEGRVERAACLLAVGRPRVAYVELRRALALEPRHRRALRLLGRAFKDAGDPARAAALLAERLSDAQPAPPPAEETDPDGPTAQDLQSVDPNLFSNLTVDLGLGAAIPSIPPRVATTQVIRRRGRPRPPRSPSELAAIDGPIVDTTQPGQVVHSSVPEAAKVETAPVTPLFELQDEPLFPEATPFEVRPVATADLGSLPDGDERDETVVDARPPQVGTAPPEEPGLRVPPAATTLPDARPNHETETSAPLATEPMARAATAPTEHGARPRAASPVGRPPA
ncbi:MAG: hypothetical protein AAFU79_09335, partial [Myxococcota bacterium]